jgi:hypothetical protein
MNKFLKPQNILSVAIFLAIVCMFTVFQVQGQNGYLEVVGPPPMRFEAKRTNEFLLAVRFPMPQAKQEPAAVSNAVVEIPTPTETNADVAKISTLTNATTSLALPVLATNQATVFSVSSGGDNPVDTSASAGDLLTTTPQMIMQYLRPDSNTDALNQTNHQPTAVFVPTWMGFMPALMQYPVENKTESRATYISK